MCVLPVTTTAIEDEHEHDITVDANEVSRKQ